MTKIVLEIETNNPVLTCRRLTNFIVGKNLGHLNWLDEGNDLPWVKENIIQRIVYPLME